MTLKLVIKNLSGQLCCIDAESSWNADDVKAAVDAKLGIPIREQRLFLNDSEVLAGETLGNMFPECCDEVIAKDDGACFVLVRRSPEVAQWLDKVKRNVLTFAKSPELIRANEEVALVAVGCKGLFLEFVGEELRSNREIVLEALQSDGMALQFTTTEMRSDQEVVLIAVQCSGHALKFASEELRSDPEIVMTAVQQCGMAIMHCLGDARESREVAIAAVKSFPMCLDVVPERFQSDREVVLIAVAGNGIALRHASEPLRADREIVLTACGNGHSSAFEYASLELRSDRDFVQEVMKQFSDKLLKYASPELQKEFAPPPPTWMETGRSAIGQAAQVAGMLAIGSIWVGAAALRRVRGTGCSSSDARKQSTGTAPVTANVRTTETVAMAGEGVTAMTVNKGTVGGNVA
eukprot:gnl/MRDRNA2_/MRDRNA2_79116_c0_seq3.p1 gnl/MRDRNA2_/MRDRNA2_79116_c0~~gnl/MRDRNA2_/MRDRNA2_79116_c0_seq3.p1  ORF type:complete len:407 (+),score=107.47 gnl/MRDRNA2_/MRDRNA2_79116_c0_seq3:63-1283(+)